MKEDISIYLGKIADAFSDIHFAQVEILANALQNAWDQKKQVFICGNGGSAGNSIHLANDFNYGIDKENGIGMKVDALPANASIITCLANDEGYEHIFSQQLKVKAKEGDILIVLSGSGNSPNVVNALQVANDMQLQTFAILGFTGGKCKELAKVPIHFEIYDMQVSEDLQMMIGHMCMQYLCKNKAKQQ